MSNEPESLAWTKAVPMVPNSENQVLCLEHALRAKLPPTQALYWEENRLPMQGIEDFAAMGYTLWSEFVRWEADPKATWEAEPNACYFQVWIKENGFLVIRPRRESTCYTIYDTDRDGVVAFGKMMESHRRPDEDLVEAVRTVLHVIVQNREGMVIEEAGYIDVSFHANHYPAEVASQFNTMIEELTAPEPSGRLHILHGPPGTGKTFWIRSLMGATRGAQFILVPSTMLEHLGMPEMINLLLTRAQEQPVPAVLIIEEADTLLTVRGADNMSAMQALLNLCDGVLGDALNIRVIATTNANRMDLDKALLRPGRLALHLGFSKLTPHEANALLTALLPHGVQAPMCTSTMSLSEVYERARAAGWKPASPALPSEAGLEGFAGRRNRHHGSRFRARMPE